MTGQGRSHGWAWEGTGPFPREPGPSQSELGFFSTKGTEINVGFIFVQYIYIYIFRDLGQCGFCIMMHLQDTSTFYGGMLAPH